MTALVLTSFQTHTNHEKIQTPDNKDTTIMVKR